MKIYDIIIIGGGVVGCAIAREFSKYKINVALIEKESDVAMGASGANSGVVHAGFNVPYGTLKAEMNIKGYALFEDMCKDLDVPYKKTGKIVIAKNEDEVEKLYKLKENGEKNGVQGLKIIEKDEIKKLEPNVEGFKGLYSKNTAITNPYLLTIALAENAKNNGCDIFLEHKVLGIKNKGEKFIIETNKGNFESRFIVNSAGIYSDEIQKMVEDSPYKIVPCRGEYLIMDKSYGNLINSMVYPVPDENSNVLGIHLTKTVDGNIIVGPSAEFIDEEEKDNRKTTSNIMNELYKRAKELVPKISDKYIIGEFAGIRPKLKKYDKFFNDFVIEESKKVPGFINLLGIESPGLTSSPAIAKKVVEILKDKIDLKFKENFNPKRKGITRFDSLSIEEKAKLIKSNGNYGEIVCRCENVTKQEIFDALNNPLNVRTIKGIKYRTRAGMGRCQGSFCMIKIVKIMVENGIDPKNITFKGKGSELFFENDK